MATEPDLRAPQPSDKEPDWDKVDASYEARMESLFRFDPRAWLAFPGASYRNALVAEEEWWAAAEVARPWMCRFKDAGFALKEERAVTRKLNNAAFWRKVAVKYAVTTA